MSPESRRWAHVIRFHYPSPARRVRCRARCAGPHVVAQDLVGVQAREPAGTAIIPPAVAGPPPELVCFEHVAAAPRCQHAEPDRQLVSAAARGVHGGSKRTGQGGGAGGGRGEGAAETAARRVGDQPGVLARAAGVPRLDGIGGGAADAHTARRLGQARRTCGRPAPRTKRRSKPSSRRRSPCFAMRATRQPTRTKQAIANDAARTPGLDGTARTAHATSAADRIRTAGRTAHRGTPGSCRAGHGRHPRCTPSAKGPKTKDAARERALAKAKEAVAAAVRAERAADETRAARNSRPRGRRGTPNARSARSTKRATALESARTPWPQRNARPRRRPEKRCGDAARSRKRRRAGGGKGSNRNRAGRAQDAVWPVNGYEVPARIPPHPLEDDPARARRRRRRRRGWSVSSSASSCASRKAPRIPCRNTRALRRTDKIEIAKAGLEKAARELIGVPDRAFLRLGCLRK